MNNIELMTRKELRKKLKISDRTLRRWVSDGTLPKPRLPGLWLATDIEAAIIGQVRPTSASDSKNA
jgi:predicted DNA-binding transcriptional regulator AlpA